MNPVTLRNKAIREARDFFAGRGILEVMTRKAVRSPALEPYIDPVALTASQTSEVFFLATSPEFAMKKILQSEISSETAAAGIYEITPVFRDDRPGKNHALEFTMIEWYQADTTLHGILQIAGDLINHLARRLGGQQVPATVKIADLETLFRDAGCVFAFGDETAVVEKYRTLHDHLPQHLNGTDAAIACFNLLFDEFILPALREEKGLVAVGGYPDCLAALAFSANGIAERAEIFYRGLELANGYREEFRPLVARARWQKYNEIRMLRGQTPHAIDEELLAALPRLENTAGIAVGLERVLIGLFPGLDMRGFFS